MTTTIDGTQVRWGRDPDDFRKYSVNVAVYSKNKPGLKANNAIDPGRSNGRDHLLQLIGTAAAACCEHLAEEYGDDLDPAEASQNAIRAFGEECRLLVALAKDAPTLVKRLESNVAKLRNEEQELVYKLRWAIDHGEKLTPVEIEWMRKRITQLHTDQL